MYFFGFKDDGAAARRLCRKLTLYAFHSSASHGLVPFTPRTTGPTAPVLGLTLHLELHGGAILGNTAPLSILRTPRRPFPTRAFSLWLLFLFLFLAPTGGRLSLLSLSPLDQWRCRLRSRRVFVSAPLDHLSGTRKNSN